MVKRTTTTTEEDNDEELRRLAQEMAELNEAEGGDVFRVTDEIRSFTGVYMMVQREEPAERQGFCANVPISVFSHEYIQKRFGTGVYKCRMKGPKGFLPGGGTVRIAETEGVVGSSGGSGEFFSYLELMEKKEAAKAEKSNRIMELVIPAGISALASIGTALLTRQGGTDIAALATALKPAPGPTLNDLASTLANMKALAAPADNNRDPLDAVLKIMERVKDLDSNGGNSTWIDVLRDGVKELAPMAKEVMAKIGQPSPQSVIMQPVPAIANAAGPSAPITESAAPGNTAPGAGANGSETDMLTLFLPMIKEKLAQIFKWAAANRDPAVYAEVFTDELPDNIGSYISREDTLKYLNNEQWFEYVTQYEPRLKPHREWCEEFRAVLIDIFSEADEPQESPSAPEVSP